MVNQPTPGYYEQGYCDEHLCNHYMEVTRTGRKVCHGENYVPHEDDSHYIKRDGPGFQVKKKRKAKPATETGVSL